ISWSHYRQAEYQNEINQPSAPGVNFDDI
ncbi:hypothetical protein, partial [Escherichia coli]